MEELRAKAERVYQIAIETVFNAKDPKTGRRHVTSVTFLKTLLQEYGESPDAVCARPKTEGSEAPIVTYNAMLSSESLKKTAFKPNPTRALRARANICIVGAGPVGLYMAILLRHIVPHLDVNVIEKRATSEGDRLLTRDKELYIPSAFISRMRLFPSQPDPAANVPMIEDVLSRLCEPLASLLRVEGGFHLLAFLSSHTRDKIRINRLEHELAKAAQAKGVRIYHDNKITDLASIEDRYTNAHTRVIFDATGGRLLPVSFPQVNVYKPTAATPKHKLNVEHRSEASIPVYEGHLDPASAILRLRHSLYVPIGDTFMKVDFRGASPGTVNGMVLCIGMALAFASSTASTASSSSQRKTRRRSRTRSAPF